MTREPTVFVVEDDDRMRRSFRWLIESIGLHAETYTSAEAFLDAYDPDWPGCMVLDLRMPGMGGLALQDELAGRDIEIPLIIVTAFADVPITVRAMTAGAAVVLEKPCNDMVLLEHIQKGILAQSGYGEVMEACDGLDALSKLGAYEPDLLLVDWNMPKMDGLTFVKECRAKGVSVPIITTEAEKTRVVEAIKAGVNNYVVKPFTPEGLSERIEETLARASAA